MGSELRWQKRFVVGIPLLALGVVAAINYDNFAHFFDPESVWHPPLPYSPHPVADAYGQPASVMGESYDAGLPQVTEVGMIQGAIDHTQAELMHHANALSGVDRACFDQMMHDIDRLQAELDAEYRAALPDGIDPLEKMQLQTTINLIENKMDAASELFPAPPFGVPHRFCA